MTAIEANMYVEITLIICVTLLLITRRLWARW